MSKPARQRRTPEEARRLILDATLGLLARLGPDAFGLKEVAREAGVSHALVTHYFGTFDALIEAAFADHTTRSRSALLERVASQAGKGPASWIAEAAAHLGDPVYGRLALWAMLSGRAEQADFFPRRERGLERVADAIVASLAADGTRPPREDVEFAMLLVLSALMGYAAAGRALWGSLGHAPSRERDAWFQSRLADVLAELAASEGREGGSARTSGRTSNGRASPAAGKPTPTRRTSTPRAKATKAVEPGARAKEAPREPTRRRARASETKGAPSSSD
jgi:AcrR family transcriptional regulator